MLGLGCRGVWVLACLCGVCVGVCVGGRMGVVTRVMQG